MKSLEKLLNKFKGKSLSEKSIAKIKNRKMHCKKHCEDIGTGEPDPVVIEMGYVIHQITSRGRGHAVDAKKSIVEMMDYLKTTYPDEPLYCSDARKMLSLFSKLEMVFDQIDAQHNKDSKKISKIFNWRWITDLDWLIFGAGGGR